MTGSGCNSTFCIITEGKTNGPHGVCRRVDFDYLVKGMNSSNQLEYAPCTDRAYFLPLQLCTSRIT